MVACKAHIFRRQMPLNAALVAGFVLRREQ